MLIWAATSVQFNLMGRMGLQGGASHCKILRALGVACEANKSYCHSVQRRTHREFRRYCRRGRGSQERPEEVWGSRGCARQGAGVRGDVPGGSYQVIA